MTFEKALEAMKQGKEVMREYWAHNSSAVIGIDTDGNGKKRLYIRHLDDPCKEKRRCHFFGSSDDALADDWKIYEPKAFYNSGEPIYNCRCEFNPDPWLLKSNQHTEDLAKQVKEKLFEAYKLEPHKEETTMYTDLEITFKSGETLTYKEGEWDDYSYDGKSVAVKKSGAWVGLYNFDNVFCVELKQRAEE
jgi:hypothetical protein